MAPLWRAGLRRTVHSARLVGQPDCGVQVGRNQPRYEHAGLRHAGPPRRRSRRSSTRGVATALGALDADKTALNLRSSQVDQSRPRLVAVSPASSQDETLRRHRQRRRSYWWVEHHVRHRRRWMPYSLAQDSRSSRAVQISRFEEMHCALDVLAPYPSPTPLKPGSGRQRLARQAPAARRCRARQHHHDRLEPHSLALGPVQRTSHGDCRMRFVEPGRSGRRDQWRSSAVN